MRKLMDRVLIVLTSLINRIRSTRESEIILNLGFSVNLLLRGQHPRVKIISSCPGWCTKPWDVIPEVCLVCFVQLHLSVCKWMNVALNTSPGFVESSKGLWFSGE